MIYGNLYRFSDNDDFIFGGYYINLIAMNMSGKCFIDLGIWSVIRNVMKVEDMDKIPKIWRL